MQECGGIRDVFPLRKAAVLTVACLRPCPAPHMGREGTDRSFPSSSWPWFWLDLGSWASWAPVTTVWQVLQLWYFQKGCSITNLERTPPIITMILFLWQHQQQMSCKSHNLFMKWELVHWLTAHLTLLSSLDHEPGTQGSCLAQPLASYVTLTDFHVAYERGGLLWLLQALAF